MKKITISQGENMQIINKTDELKDFFMRKMKITVCKTRDFSIRLDRFSNDQIKHMSERTTKQMKINCTQGIAAIQQSTIVNAEIESDRGKKSKFGKVEHNIYLSYEHTF